MRVAFVVRLGPMSMRLRPRLAMVLIVLGATATALGIVGLMLGDYGLSAGQVLRTLAGAGDDPLATYFVTELRLPRIVAALSVGAALGTAGSMFQTVTGNPLGSPDIIGFTTGAATGALIPIIVLGATGPAVSIGALAGGLGTALVVHLLLRPHGLTGQRLVLVGIGVGATLAAVNTLLVVRASLDTAQDAGFWLAGSLGSILWPRAGLAIAATAILVAADAALHRPLQMLALGDDTARAVGVPTQGVRTAAIAVAVALVSVATAVTGPIAFVALAAPQIARRLSGTPTTGTAGPALTGAVLVLASDLVARTLFAPKELAVGVVTGALGGVYLIGLLATNWRK